MNWHKEEVLKKCVSLAICSLLLIFSVAMIIGTLSTGSGKGVFLFVIMFLFFVLSTWANYKSLMGTIKKYKKSTDEKLINELRNINIFNSEKEMRTEFDNQKQNKLYEDDEFIITETFFANNGKDLLIIDGILDVKVIVERANGVIQWTSLNILYYDGNKYEFRIDRPLGISNMKEQVNKLEQVAVMISQKSKNFRKYSSCVF